MVVSFGVFILAGGATHALGVYNIWVPTWWLSGGVKAVTAVASLTTAGLLWRLLPDILTLPSPSQLAAANTVLQEEAAERQRAAVGLGIAQADLETRVETRTRELAAANRALHHSEARLAGIIASAPDAIITVNEAQRIVVFNAAAERMFGCPVADALGGPLDRFIPARFRHAHTEHMLYSVIIRDLTERERAEEVFHQTATQLQQAQKMEAVGRLAGGVAHDFNNLLTAVIGHAELALAAADPASTVHADVERIRSAATKAAAVTGQLLTFSRKQKLDLRIVDLGRLVTELAATLHPMLGEDVRLELSLAPDLGLVRADPNGGSLTIEMANVDFAEAALVTKANLPPGAYVMLEVSDTGVGMTPDVQARIFEPFFTTKGPTKGTGLGLAMVYGIVTQSGGQISVYSERRPRRRPRLRGAPACPGARGADSPPPHRRHDAGDERSPPGRRARAGSSRDGRALHVGVHGANRRRARVPPGGDNLSPEAVHPGGVDPKSARDAGRVPPDVTAPVERPWA